MRKMKSALTYSYIDILDLEEISEMLNEILEGGELRKPHSEIKKLVNEIKLNPMYI